MSLITLPLSGYQATLRDFVPHKVVLAFNEAMYKGVQIKSTAVTPTKEEILKEFGATVVKELDSLPASEYEKRLGELREEFLRRRMDMEGLSLGNVQEANLRKVEGMVMMIGNEQPISRDTITGLPHEDVEFLLEQIEAISAAQRAKKGQAQHGS